MRGCPRNCAFCLAKAIYHPVRSLKPETLAEWLDQHPDCSDLGLVAPSLFDHQQIEEIFSMLAKRNIRIRNSSVKWEKLQPQLLEILRRSGVTGLTLAPETGSKRLQTAINKPLNEIRFIECVREIFAAGFEQLKLYFVACLPGEEEQDLDATIDFINTVVKASPSAGHVSAAFSLFVPKRHTLWQKQAAPTLQEMKHTVKYLKEGLSKLSTQLKTSFASPQEALRQSWLSQVGPELAIEYAREATKCRENRLFSRNQFSALEF
ncbi:MAG: Radical SAM [uncultured bacterium]|nr:MAG: Radical SAM [uncultured bacterium]